MFPRGFLGPEPDLVDSGGLVKQGAVLVDPGCIKQATRMPHARSFRLLGLASFLLISLFCVIFCD